MIDRTKIIVSVICSVIISIVVTLGVQQILNWKKAAEKAETRKATAEAASGIINDMPLWERQQEVLDQGLILGRETFNRDMEKARNEDPVLRSRSSDVVDQRVRNAFRKRRLARERLGCAGDECEE